VTSGSDRRRYLGDGRFLPSPRRCRSFSRATVLGVASAARPRRRQRPGKGQALAVLGHPQAPKSPAKRSPARSSRSFCPSYAKFRAEMLEAAGFRISLEIPYGRIYEPYAVRLRAWLGDVVAALVGHRGVRRASAGWRSEWRRRTPACTRGGRSSEGAMARARSARGSPR
jgi:hypothetical protein